MFVVKNELIVRDKEDTHPRAIFHGQSIRLIASMTGRAKFSSVIHNRPMVFFFSSRMTLTAYLVRRSRTRIIILPIVFKESNESCGSLSKHQNSFRAFLKFAELKAQSKRI